MAQVAANADDYANARVNIFFPGVTSDLDGQCVSLVKWFMQEMSEVPDPQAARGDARYVGKNLVAQGHAVEVPYDQRKRGDIVCYEYGQYGHIGVILSDNRTFEENVNWAGVSSKIVDGARVYASRIGSMSETWRHDMHIYRLNSYNETGANMPYISQEELDDLNKWKAIGIDAQPYKDAVVGSNAWTSDMQSQVTNVQPVINDLWQFKKDHSNSDVIDVVINGEKYVPKKG